jgi:catechol 2,3-dioxygenase-like lactoylglutathione lyase family enzyme
VGLTGFGNLALKVADLDAAATFYRSVGAVIGERAPWHGGERLDVELAGLAITLFTRAIYEDQVDLPPACFLHVAVFTDDLDAELVGREPVWGPAVVEGSFGRRRIAFVDAPGDTRLEFMEQLDDPPRPGGDR